MMQPRNTLPLSTIMGYAVEIRYLVPSAMSSLAKFIIASGSLVRFTDPMYLYASSLHLA